MTNQYDWMDVDDSVKIKISPTLEVLMAAVETKEPKLVMKVTVKHKDTKDFPFFYGQAEYSVELMVLK